SAARSPTTSASSATSASKSPSSASPAPAPNQAEHTTRPPDPGRHLHPAPLTLHRVLPHAQLISIFRVRRLGVRVPPARHRFPRSRVGPLSSRIVVHSIWPDFGHRRTAPPLRHRH